MTGGGATVADDRIHDVLQIGYGPVGIACALGLGRLGHDVAVIERQPTLYNLSRAGHIDHEIMRVLQGLGVAAQLEPDFVPSRGFALLDDRHEEILSIEGISTSDSGWSPDYNIYQPVLERALDDAVSALPNVTVHRGWHVVALDQQPDHLVVTMRPKDGGDEHSMRARYVLGADGANSTVRGLLGKTWDQDLGFEGSWLVCDFEHHDPNVELDWSFDLSQILDPGRPVSAARWTGRRHSRLEFMILPGESVDEMTDAQAAWTLAKPFNLTPERSTLVRHAVYTFRSLLVRDWRADRVLLVGDAAHVMPPFLGQGMCSGMRDAATVAWKLDLVLRGVSDPALLDSYTAERHPHVETITRMAVGLGGVIATLDPAVAAGRNAMFRSQGMPDLPRLPGLEDGVLYRDADGRPAPGAGQLGVQGEVRRGDVAGLHDDVVGAGWHIISKRPLSFADLEPRHQDLITSIGGHVTYVTPGPVDDPMGADALLDVTFTYRAWFATLGADAVVVRPDFYIFAAVGDLAELTPVLDDLADQLRLG